MVHSVCGVILRSGLTHLREVSTFYMFSMKKKGVFAGRHMSLGFQWDPRKAVANERKHGVNFEEAFTVFDDPYARIFADQWHSEAESREIIIGHSSAGRLLLVAFTEQPDRTLRVISARRATPKEQRDYEHRSGT